MKRVFIVHGWEGSPDEPLFQWLKAELEEKGFEVTVPTMPDPDYPKIETWVPYLREVVAQPDINTFFIGHSLGCQTIIRYLETLPENTKIGGAVFMAGWYDVRNLETEEEWQIIGPWVKTPRDDGKIKRIINRVVVILSDNDHFVSLENKTSWEEKVGAKVIVEHEKGHFTEGDGVNKLPSALEAILTLLE